MTARWLKLTAFFTRVILHHGNSYSGRLHQSRKAIQQRKNIESLPYFGCAPRRIVVEGTQSKKGDDALDLIHEGGKRKADKPVWWDSFPSSEQAFDSTKTFLE